MSLTRNLTLPIVAAGAAIVKTGIDFDTTLRQIVALTDTTAGEIGGIKQQILDLANVVGKDPTELARGFYFLASAGFDTSQALDILTQTAKASAAGWGDGRHQPRGRRRDQLVRQGEPDRDGRRRPADCAR